MITYIKNPSQEPWRTIMFGSYEEALGIIAQLKIKAYKDCLDGSLTKEEYEIRTETLKEVGGAIYGKLLVEEAKAGEWLDGQEGGGNGRR
jgi:hypothetical protein